MRSARILAAIVAMTALSPSARAESIAAVADLSLAMSASADVVSPGQSLQLQLRVTNDGNFGVDTVVVEIQLPDELILTSAVPDLFDPVTGLWTLPEGLLAYDQSSLVLMVDVADTVDAPITVIAEVVEASGSWSPYDPDSTPANQAPCEDDYAIVTLELAGRDAGAGDPDAGPSCPPPPTPADAGAGGGGAGDRDAGIGDPASPGVGCSAAAGPPDEALLLLLLLPLAWRRRLAVRFRAGADSR